MKFDAALRILAVASLCALGLIALVVREGVARASGTEAILSMEATDPRSLLSGHYVIVNIQEATTIPGQCDEINAINDRAHETSRQETAWLALRDRSGQLHSEDAKRTISRHVVVGQYASRDEARRHGPLVVRGVATCTNPEIAGDIGRAGIMRVQLEGIDRFYVNQADARRIEHVLRSQRPGEARVFVIVSVGRDSRPRLKGLIVDERRLELQWL